MRRCAWLVAIAGAVLILCGCSIIRAQQSPAATTGTLQGVITGPSGPVADATVAVTASDATQHVGQSDSGGFYSITTVPTGPATFAVRAAGFSEYDGSMVITADPDTNRQDISLNPQ
jgi:hypothetical protein